MGEVEVFDNLVATLRILEVGEGDVVLLKGDLTEVGLLAKTPKASRELIFSALWKVLGGEEKGTLITSSFTNPFFTWNLTDFVFDESSPSKGGGAITKYFLEHPHSFRSKHPTNSFVAIGKHAKYLVDGHDENSRPYDPVGKAIELNGKAISLGAVAQPPDFMTGHYAQQQAGLTKGSITKYFMGIRYKKNNEVKVFKVREIGGCSRGHFLVYAHYVASKKLKTAFFGKAYSISMPAKTAFDISYALQVEKPRSFFCNNPDCFSCRGSWFWNLRDWPLYYLRNVWHLVSKLFNAKK